MFNEWAKVHHIRMRDLSALDRLAYIGRRGMEMCIRDRLYSTASGAMQETPKTQAHKVRPIITINN